MFCQMRDPRTTAGSGGWFIYRDHRLGRLRLSCLPPAAQHDSRGHAPREPRSPWYYHPLTLHPWSHPASLCTLFSAFECV